MFDVDERLAVLERDWILVRVFIFGCVVRGPIGPCGCPLCTRVITLLRFQALLLDIFFIIFAEKTAVAVPYTRACNGGGAYSETSRAGP